MKVQFRVLGFWFAALGLLFSGAGINAQTSDPLIVKMAANEKQLLAKVSKYTPLVETYLQLMSKDGELPAMDRYFLHRVRLGKTLEEVTYDEPGKRGSFLQAALHAPAHYASLAIRRAPMSFDRAGFLEMLSPDIHGFDPANYKIDFVRNEFLGGLKVAVYDVAPAKKAGYFRGRFFVDGDGNLVRFVGSFTEKNVVKHPHYTHFDSWRANIKDAGWLPWAVYVEEPLAEGALHGQVRIWGYGLAESLKSQASSVTVAVDNAVDHSGDNSDVDPIAAMQSWKDMATENVLDRMERAGMLAPRGSFDKILDQIVINLSVPNDLAFAEPVHCRIMLTTPIEATTVGHTILISKGLIETLPSEEAIASVVAFELAHMVKIASVDTRFSFADRMQFADKDVSRQLVLSHSYKENEEAAKAALVLLGKSMYAGKMDNISLYYEQMQEGVGRLKELYRPQVGDSLISPSGKPWVLAALTGKGPHLEPANLHQLAALPLGSNLVVDPWSGEVRLSEAPRVLPQSIDEKRPFAVMPVYMRLKTASAVTKQTNGETSHTVAQAGGTR